MRELRKIVFIAELNGLERYRADIKNPSFEARTNEKVCLIVGLVFGDYEGPLLMIYKALYGLKTTGSIGWRNLLTVSD